MILVNGHQQDTISALDRGLLYGDGVFETIAVRKGRMTLWDRHMQRLVRGCERLAIPIPDITKLKSEADWLAGHAPLQVIKIIITRGEGGRGYNIPDQQHPTRILSTHAWPVYPEQMHEKGIRAKICEHRLGVNPALAGIKHLNRLEQVLARHEIKGTDYFEGLLRDTDSNIIEGTLSNVFMVKQGNLYTPDLSGCGVEGVMRSLVLELASNEGIKCNINSFTVDELLSADEVFLTNSLAGIVPVTGLEQQSYPAGAITKTIQKLIHNKTI